MKKLERISVLITAIFTAAMFYIIPASAVMSNPIYKYNSMNSMTSKTELTLNLSASDLNEQDQENFDMLQPLIDDMRISAVSKMNTNKDHTMSNQYMHLMLNIGGTPVDTAIWAKTDLTGKNPNIKEVIRVPKMMKDYMPENLQGKEYAVLDLSNQNNGKLNMNKLSLASNKLVDAVTNSISTMPVGLLPIKDRGTGTLKTPEGIVNVHNYTLKLDDNSFKILLKYSVNNLSSNKDVIAALKDYIAAVGAMNDQDAKELSNEIDKGMPEFIKAFNTSMENIKNTRILGKKGIVINYSLNNDGYIVNANGVVDFIIKADALNQLENTADQSKTSAPGAYNLTVKFNSNMYNINKTTNIIIPYLDKKNSFDLLKAMDDMNNQEG